MPDTPDTPNPPPGSPSSVDPYDAIGPVYSGETPADSPAETTLIPASRTSGGGGGGGGGRDDDDEDEEDDDDGTDPRAKMGFFDHLEELRWTLIKCVAAFLFFFIVNLCFLREISEILQWPLRYGLDNPEFQLKLNSVGEIFAVALQVPFILGIGFSLPAIVYFIANFVAPGLRKKEKSIMAPACMAIFVLFLIGAVFSFFVLLPTSVKVAKELANLMDFQIDWNADSYFDLVTWMLLGIGLAFEFPLVILVLVYIGLISTDVLREYRTHAFVFFLIFAAIITPTTDPFTFLLLAGPLQILYEISIWSGRALERRRAAREEMSD